MNALMSEYCAIVGIGRRFGTPYRPVEQGLVEGLHKETQKIMGMLVKDVFQCLPNEVGELMYVVEFVVGFAACCALLPSMKSFAMIQHHTTDNYSFMLVD